MADLFMDEDAAKWARRRRCHCLRTDEPAFGLTPEEDAELDRLTKEFGDDLSKEQPVFDSLKLSRPQMSMLRSHEIVAPRGVAYTGHLGARRTWDWLYAHGFLAGGRLTHKGRRALAADG
jgi:hypothetical protein